jgi:nucleoside-diphosphate-sugar epimerase
MGMRARLHPIPFADLPPDASPYGPDPRRSAGYDLDRARRDLGFEPSALEDALAETLAWYRVARPSHPGYANRAKELALAGVA